MRPQHLLYSALLACTALGCVEPGSIDSRQREQFQRLLDDHADAGTLAHGGADEDGGGAAGADAGAMASSGCPEACALLQQHCALSGCHAGSAPAASLDLSSDGLVERLGSAHATTAACSGRALIDGTAPDESVLYGKLLDPPLCGLRMPIGTPLGPDQIACMRRFVAKPACADGGL